MADWAEDQAKENLGESATREDVAALTARYRNAKKSANALGVSLYDYKAGFEIPLNDDEVAMFRYYLSRPTALEKKSLEKARRPGVILDADDLNALKAIVAKKPWSFPNPNIQSQVDLRSRATDLEIAVKAKIAGGTIESSMLFDRLVASLNLDPPDIEKSFLCYQPDSLYRKRPSGPFFLRPGDNNKLPGSSFNPLPIGAGRAL